MIAAAPLLRTNCQSSSEMSASTTVTVSAAVRTFAHHASSFAESICEAKYSSAASQSSAYVAVLPESFFTFSSDISSFIPASSRSFSSEYLSSAARSS